jgi:hypothetical protein
MAVAGDWRREEETLTPTLSRTREREEPRSGGG